MNPLAFRSSRFPCFCPIRELTSFWKIFKWLTDENKIQIHSDSLNSLSGISPDGWFFKNRNAHEEYLSQIERKKIEKLIEKRREDVELEKREEDLHTEMQYHLLKIGNALGYDVIAASNDRSKSHCGNSFSFMSLPQFPEINLEKDTLNTVKLINVLWFQKGN